MKLSIDDLKQHIVVLKNIASTANMWYNTSKHSYIGLFNTMSNMEKVGIKPKDIYYQRLKDYDMNVKRDFDKKINAEKELHKYEKRLYHRLYYQKIKDIKKEEYQKKKAQNK